MSTRISQLSAMHTFHDDDLLLITDVSDDTHSPEGTSKQITCQALLSGSSVDLTGLSGNWENTYTTVGANSATWDSTHTTVSANSADWSGESAFSFVAITGTDQDTLSAGSTTDTLTISAISGINVTTLSASNTIVLEVTGASGGGTSYTDSDVDTHLNTSGASDGMVLSYTSGDYSWVTQTGGGTSSSGGGTSPGYTTVQATSTILNSTTITNIANIPLNGSTDKFKVVEKNGDGTKWRLNLTGGTTGEYYTFRIAWDNIYPRGYGNNYEYYDDAVLPTTSYFDVGWDGDYTTPTRVLEKKLQQFRPANFAGPRVDITRVHVSRQPYEMTLQCNLNVASGSTVTTDSNGNKWLTNSGAYSSLGNGWLWYLAINGYPLDADPHSTPEGGIMRYIYAYDDGNGGPMLKYWDANFNMAEISTTSDLTVKSTATYGNDTVVTEATWWDTDFIYMIMENHDNTDMIGSGGNYEGRQDFITNV